MQGVIKALHDHKLLPRVLSGSSAGSVACAIVATKTDEELLELFQVCSPPPPLPPSHCIGHTSGLVLVLEG